MTVTADDVENSTLGSRSFGGAAEPTQAKIRLPRIVTAGEELESLCRSELESQEATDLHSRQSDSDDAGGARNASAMFRGFPRLCLPIVKMLAGNHCCVDCGDEDGERLEYASLGYGTLLCQDCAYRHQTNTFAESQVKSLEEDIWTYRSVLALLEGSNTQMLEFIKNKPRWRPSKSAKTNDTEDVAAFKQIYLSKAATAYRKLLAKKVDNTYISQLQSMKEDDEAKAKIVLATSLPPPGPFDHIFETMNVTPDQIPGFNQISSSKLGVGGSGANRGGQILSSFNGGVKLAPKMLQQEKDSLEAIKAKINMRRSTKQQINSNFNTTIAASNRNERETRVPFDPYAPHMPKVLAQPVPDEPFVRKPAFTRRNSIGEVGDATDMPNVRDYAYSRRRSSGTNGGLVGEVGQYAFQDNPVGRDDDSIGNSLDGWRRPFRRMGSGGVDDMGPPHPLRPRYRP
mmetsp:Transcript_6941/g.14279  ORF Transcript_6941/g.14279 Transcript_6941/m.14279 type:complete len:457 (-) Transcript_6941:108-1478(-)